MKLLKILTFLLAFSVVQTTFAGNVTLKQSLDSAYIIMGRTTTLNIELLKNGPLSGSVVVQDKSFPAEVEISSTGKADTLAMDNDRYQFRRQIVIQSFDSGVYTLPPVLYIERGETIASSPVSLKVVPVPVDSLKDIHDYADVQDSGLRWFDNLPDWLVDGWLWILIGLAVVGAAVWTYLKYFRRKAETKVESKPKEPPYDEAVRRLTELREEHLCENGQEREFYTRLTEILREYLQHRFGINAMEMTSSQILDALESREDTRMSRSVMDQVLQMADFVKFAKVRPLPDDNVKSFRGAMQFVEDTKPVEQTDLAGNTEQELNEKTL